MKIYNKDLWAAAIVFAGCSYGFYFCTQIPDTGEVRDWAVTPNMLYLYTTLCALISITSIVVLVRRYIKAYKAKKALEAVLFMPNETKDIVINSTYTHIKGRYKVVTITNKTKNSIEFKELQGYTSWVTFDEFNKFFKQFQFKIDV